MYTNFSASTGKLIIKECNLEMLIRSASTKNNTMSMDKKRTLTNTILQRMFWKSLLKNAGEILDMESCSQRVAVNADEDMAVNADVDMADGNYGQFIHNLDIIGNTDFDVNLVNFVDSFNCESSNCFFDTEMQAIAQETEPVSSLISTCSFPTDFDVNLVNFEDSFNCESWNCFFDPEMQATAQETEPSSNYFFYPEMAQETEPASSLISTCSFPIDQATHDATPNHFTASYRQSPLLFNSSLCDVSSKRDTGVCDANHIKRVKMDAVLNYGNCSTEAYSLFQGPWSLNNQIWV